MATTINYVIHKEPRKDGTHLVEIRIIHNRKQRRLPTSIYLRKAQLSKDLTTIKDTRACESATLKVMELRNRLLELTNAEYMSIDQLVTELTRPTVEGFRLDFFDFAEQRIPNMKPKTAECYTTALNAVERFIGKRSLDINEIDGRWVRRFKDFLENEPPVKGVSNNTYKRKGKGTRAISSYLASLRALHNQAREIYNDDDTGTIYIPRQPFGHGVIPRQPKTDHRVLTIAQIRAVMMAKTEPGSRADLAKDVFMLSFALAGANTIDIYVFKHSDINGELLTYDRTKTKDRRDDHARITVKIPQLAADIMSKYATDGKLALSFAQRYSSAVGFNHAVNRGLKTVAELAGIDVDLQTYFARHSWATIARNVCHVDWDTVNAGLNHVKSGADRVGDIYIARDYSAIWAAQEAVMAEVLRPVSAEVKMNRAM